MDVSDVKALHVEVKKRMDGQIDFVRKELSNVRTGRAPGMRDGVRLKPTARRCANRWRRFIPEPALIVRAVDPSSWRVERRFASRTGLNPAATQVLRIPIPSLTTNVQ